MSTASTGTALNDVARSVLKALGESGGYEKAVRLASLVNPPRSVETVRRTALDLVGRGLVKRAGKGGWLFGLTEEGAAAINGHAPSPVQTGIDYGLVLEDLRRRRDELDAAAAAIERIHARESR